MEVIKTIQTEYKGYRFRSRLEARWAVFFDALGVKWEYEFEGYPLSTGGGYLPDFWLPNLKLYAEVKPDGGDFSKPWQFVADIDLVTRDSDGLVDNNREVLLCEGIPLLSALKVISWSGSWADDNEDYIRRSSDQEVCFWYGVLFPCIRCGTCPADQESVGCCWNPWKHESISYPHAHFHYFGCSSQLCPIGCVQVPPTFEESLHGGTFMIDPQRIDKAVRTARSARFEFNDKDMSL